MSLPIFPPTLLPNPHPIPSDPSLLLRPLQRDDHLLGHCAVLNVLSPTKDMTAQEYQKVWDAMKSREGTYYPVVVVAPSPQPHILGSATLLLEHKLLRSGSLVGHIEDVAVSPLAQGKGLGKVLVQALAALAERLGAYKVILDCSEENVGFYERCGFWRKEVEMVQYFGAAKVGKEPPPPSGGAPPAKAKADKPNP